MERIVGTRRQNAEGKPLRCGEDSSLLADTPMRSTPQSGTHGRRSLNRMLKEALQKYPEQSFAQKFSLCNRQKFSGRKIKEGF